MAQQETRGALCVGDTSRKQCRKAVDSFERPVEALEDAIELDSHREGQCVAGVVVRRNRRTTLVLEVVGVILGLEHVEDVWPERLGRLNHVGDGWVALPGHLEIARGPVNGDTVLDQRVQELDRRGEIRLVRRKDVSPRVPIFRLSQHGEVLIRHTAGAAESLCLPLLSPAPTRRNRGVDLVDQLWMNRPAVAASPLDGVPAHQVAVVQHRFPVPRRVVHHGPVGCYRVIDRLAEVPLLGLDG